MKTFNTHAIAAALLIFGFAPLRAQVAAPSAVSSAALPTPAPAATSATSQQATASPSSATPAASPQAGAPEPQALPLMPEAAQGPPPQPSATSREPISKPDSKNKTLPAGTGQIEELRQNVRIRELTTQVLQENAGVNQWKDTADHATTFAGRRAAMRNYYTLLYTQIEKHDPTLHDVMETRLYQRLWSLEQHRVSPSKLIEPIAELPGSHSADHAPAKAAPEASPAAEGTGETPESAPKPAPVSEEP